MNYEVLYRKLKHCVVTNLEILNTGLDIAQKLGSDVTDMSNPKLAKIYGMKELCQEIIGNCSVWEKESYNA